jgi:hypothetical protein
MVLDVQEASAGGCCLHHSRLSQCVRESRQRDQNAAVFELVVLLPKPGYQDAVDATASFFTMASVAGGWFIVGASGHCHGSE